MIDEKRLDAIRIARGCGHDEAQELIRLARLGLEYKELIDKENGKANVLAVLELGRWAKHHGVPALERFNAKFSPGDNWYPEFRDIMAALPKEEN